MSDYRWRATLGGAATAAALGLAASAGAAEYEWIRYRAADGSRESKR